MIVQNTNPPTTTFGDVPNGGAFTDPSGGPHIKTQDDTAVRLDNGMVNTTFSPSTEIGAYHPNAVVDLNP